jgi:hypothetical protein
MINAPLKIAAKPAVSVRMANVWNGSDVRDQVPEHHVLSTSGIPEPTGVLPLVESVLAVRNPRFPIQYPVAEAAVPGVVEDKVNRIPDSMTRPSYLRRYHYVQSYRP